MKKTVKKSGWSQYLTSFGGLLTLAVLAMGAIVAVMAVGRSADNRQQAYNACNPDIPGEVGCRCTFNSDCKWGLACTSNVCSVPAPKPDPDTPPVPTTPPNTPPNTPPGSTPNPSATPRPLTLSCPSVAVEDFATGKPMSSFALNSKVRVTCDPRKDFAGKEVTRYRFYLWRIDSNRVAGGELYRVGGDAVLKNESAPYQIRTAGTYIAQCSYYVDGQWSELKPWPKSTAQMNGVTDNAASVLSDAALLPDQPGPHCRVKITVK